MDGIETVITHEFNENDELDNWETESVITTRSIPESSYVHRTETTLPETGHGEIIENKIEVQESYTYINDVNQSYTQVHTKISDTGYDNYYYGNRRISSDEAMLVTGVSSFASVAVGAFVATYLTTPIGLFSVTVLGSHLFGHIAADITEYFYETNIFGIRNILKDTVVLSIDRLITNAENSFDIIQSNFELAR